MPNLRGMFTPDPGFTLFEADLPGADARVVAWEADDTPLKDAFRQDLDVHAFNAETIWRQGAALSEYRKQPKLKLLRQRAKTAVHAVDYGCKARTLAEHIQVTVGEADRFITTWFMLHPGIRDWHRQTQSALMTKRAVTNIWGYTRRYFDRPAELLPEALAWIGQSTTAIAINRILVQLAAVPGVQVLLQTHDSVTFQVLTAAVPVLMPRLREACTITIPYPDPLVMSCDIATSTTSWGELKEIAA